MTKVKPVYEWKITEWYMMKLPVAVVGFIETAKLVALTSYALVLLGTTENLRSIGAAAGFVGNLYTFLIFILVIAGVFGTLFAPMIYIASFGRDRARGLRVFLWSMFWIILVLSAAGYFMNRLPEPQQFDFTTGELN